jgi:hypothetical protein
MAIMVSHWDCTKISWYGGLTQCIGACRNFSLKRLRIRLVSETIHWFSVSASFSAGLDIFIGLPKEENYRTAYQYPHKISLFELLQAPHYWNAVVALFTDPYSIISRAISNPPEIDKVLYYLNCVFLTGFSLDHHRAPKSGQSFKIL